LAAENWKAWLEKAEVYAELKKGKDALVCFKRVLFLNPNHPVARRAVAKLEVLTADEYDDDLFSMQPLQKADLKEDSVVQPKGEWQETPPALERVLALVDALTVRLDTKKALELLNDCSSRYGSHPEIDSRRLRLSSYDNPDFISPKKQKNISLARQELIHEKQIAVLNELLRRIELKKTDRLST
jgi:tetratricopeptide (TPR) repeat protein